MKLIVSVLSVLAFAAFANGCGDEAITAIISVIGDDTASLTNAFEAFRTSLGEPNNVNNPGNTEGHRQINWDGAGVPFEMPGNFFADTIDRGLTITSHSNHFRVSNPGNETDSDVDNRFDSINPLASQDFSTFSANRLFSPIKDKKINITFTVPGAAHPTPATVTGFGAIFVDVDLFNTTKVTYLDQFDCEIYSAFVLPNDKGLSFLGVTFGEPFIKTVIIELGNAKLDGHCTEGNTLPKGKGKVSPPVINDCDCFGCGYFLTLWITNIPLS